MARVFFIGAGPGDPELITLKGKNIIEKADIIIYAGSLVNKEILNFNKKGAIFFNSAEMTLNDVAKIYKNNKNEDIIIARVHTGDPSLYGAIREQMTELEKLLIEYEVVPGVSSLFAAAAALKKEFTLPGVSQSLICTRLEGRTSVPDNESLDKLASHKSSMAIFLSVQMIDKVVEKLLRYYNKTTPTAVVQRASWKDEKRVTGTLADIADKIKAEGIKKTALILVGDFLGDQFDKSKLYDKNFSHEYRKKS